MVHQLHGEGTELVQRLTFELPVSNSLLLEEIEEGGLGLRVQPGGVILLAALPGLLNQLLQGLGQLLPTALEFLENALQTL